MKRQKMKTLNLNKFRIAELKYTDFIKGGTRTVEMTQPANPCTIIYDTEG